MLKIKTLIIAAGCGQRLGSFTDKLPKPLIPILGLTLLERIILGLKKAGVAEFVIVNGYLGQAIVDMLGDGKNLGVTITHISNPDWEKGQGFSILSAKKELSSQRKFILCMADHIFDPGIVSQFMREAPLTDGMVVGIDKDLTKIDDVQEATKVNIEGGKIRSIGKDLTDFNAVDCGIFLCNPAIFEVFERLSLEHSKCELTLTQGIRELIKRENVYGWDIQGRSWYDVDTPQDFRRVEKKLLQSLTKPGDGIVSRFFNRKVSLQITRLIVWTRITPNQITASRLLLGIICAFSFVARHPVVAAVLVHLYSIIDGVDGELAKAKFMESQYGESLDQKIDRLADALIILAFTFMIYNLSEPCFKPWAVFLGLTASIGCPIFFFTPTKYKIIRQRLPNYWINLPVLRLIFKRDVFRFVLTLGCILGYYFSTLAVLAGMSIMYDIFSMLEDCGIIKKQN